MAFKPGGDVQPDYAPLITSLNTSRSQQKDNPVWQTLFVLIKSLIQSQGLFVDQDAAINVDLSAIKAATVITVNDETNTFANSRRLLAGTGVSFDDSVANVRTISAAGSGVDYVAMTTGATPGPELLGDGFGNAIYVLYTA